MPKYRAMVRGENFLLAFMRDTPEEAPEKTCFYTTRFVEAADPTAAEYQAMELIRQEVWPDVINDRSDTPMMYLEEIEERDSFQRCPVPGSGFTFFAMDAADAEIETAREIEASVGKAAWWRKLRSKYKRHHDRQK